MLCDYLSQGMDASLGEPNPDIILRVNGRTYNIECKRVISPTQVEKNFKAAVKQILPVLALKSETERGVIAISITRLMHGASEVLDAQDPESGFEFNKQALRDFVLEYRHTWFNHRTLTDDRVPAIIFH